MKTAILAILALALLGIGIQQVGGVEKKMDPDHGK